MNSWKISFYFVWATFVQMPTSNKWLTKQIALAYNHVFFVCAFCFCFVFWGKDFNMKKIIPLKSNIWPISSCDYLRNFNKLKTNNKFEIHLQYLSLHVSIMTEQPVPLHIKNEKMVQHWKGINLTLSHLNSEHRYSFAFNKIPL